MKKLIPVLLGLLIVSGATAQDNATLQKHYLKVYKQALAYNDANAAINALQNYIVTDNNLSYKDTLSMLYFNVKSYYSSLLLSEEVYKAAPENVIAMARAAECYDELGDPKTATELYEKVVPKTKNPYHIYRLGICQYQLKRTAECEASARAALADTSSKRIGVIFTMADGSQQTVPVDAAAANLLGVLKMDAKNFAGAKIDFQQALKLYPDFAGAKLNLDVCDKNLKGGTKTPVKAPTKPKG
ncbi:MAG TPA: tetratricopeptide repeat protein [Chitinophagaceae bacterium]|nr:tetratricopeptide repeat protein [Chitinophagaceae bacterium]